MRNTFKYAEEIATKTSRPNRNIDDQRARDWRTEAYKTVIVVKDAIDNEFEFESDDKLGPIVARDLLLAASRLRGSVIGFLHQVDSR